MAALLGLAAPLALVASCTPASDRAAPVAAVPAPPPPAPSVAPPPASPAVTASPPPPCSETCNGSPTPALVSALRGAAGKAKGCYTKLLRTADATGKMMVELQVEPGGAVCRATVHSGAPGLAPMEGCVQELFLGRTFPAPEGGCLAVNLPLSLSIKDADAGADAAP
jgi:hypothetical protein